MPWLLRMRRRRQRLRRSRATSDPNRCGTSWPTRRIDLGLGWSSARSTRQVAAGSASTGADRRGPSRRCARWPATVERDRYAADAATVDRQLGDWLGRRATGSAAVARSRRRVASRTAARVGDSPASRWRARLLPASLSAPGRQRDGRPRRARWPDRSSRRSAAERSSQADAGRRRRRLRTRRSGDAAGLPSASGCRAGAPARAGRPCRVPASARAATCG